MAGIPIKRPPLYVGALAVAYMVWGAWYLGWRVTVINWQVPLFSVPLYCAELFGFVSGLLYLLMTYWQTVRTVPEPPVGLTVDVFVPTYNESVDLVRQTLLAVLRIDYPHKTWLLDDGNRDKMRDLARELGCEYLARAKNVHAKAGNLNHALSHSDGEFVAIFDADHAPRKDFLKKTLGYFEDPTVAFVQTPQDFYNTDSFNHRASGRWLWSEQSLFFKVIQRGKDSWNAAFFCGSCAVLRRSAVEAVGGFAVDTVTEDIHTSLRLHQKGYKSVYQPESLAFGLAPHSIDAYLSQRLRWGMGAMQVFRREHILTGPGLTLAQRLNYFASILVYFEGWQKMIFYLSSPAVFFFGILPITATMREFLSYFLIYYALSLAVYVKLARGYGALFLNEQYGMARCFTFVATSIGFFRRKVGFSVTSKELSVAGRTWLWLVPTVTIALFTIIGLPIGFYRTENGTLEAGVDIANSLWSLNNIVTALAIMRFSLRRARNRRAEYRFPLRIPTYVAFSDSGSLGLTENLSARGLLYSGIVESKPSVGTSVNIHLYLPNLVIQTDATVTSVDAIPMALDAEYRIGLRFDWAPAEAVHLLESFLFGSSLQFDWSSGDIPPPTWFSRITGGSKDRVALFDERFRWHVALLDQGPQLNRTPVAIASVDDDPWEVRLIVSNLECAAGRRAMLTQYISGADCAEWITLEKQREIETPTGPLYFYGVATSGALTDYANHANHAHRRVEENEDLALASVHRGLRRL
ncbi:glycosyl transferase 2 family protein [Burkholderia pseudomallei ABCPW 30]|uniref:glycosyltransferase n=1 Tax=Burkholderia pseudomallei TaxID=28450 RepID=UPI0005389F55|nr:glycosyltransferase [Burkholderia pseudomallei]KGV95437.1 glycosyl transferase 2 family protein [Burkholderia pseudomallei ABCPW 30]